MAFFNRDGIWFTVDGDISDCEDLIHRAKLDLAQMKARHPGLDVLTYERPREYKIRSTHGRDEVFISREYRGEGFEKEEIRELDLANLVIAYEISKSISLDGFYVTALFPAPSSREEGNWPNGFYWFDDDSNLPNYPAWDNDIRWGQLINPVYYVMDSPPDEWRWELHPLSPIATDKRSHVDNDGWSDNYQEGTGWVPGTPQTYGINPWMDPQQLIAYEKPLYGPNLSGTHWWADAYWDPECIIDVQNGVLRGNTLWEFWWPPRPYGENISNLAYTAPTPISSAGPNLFYLIKGRSGFYTTYHNKDQFCLQYDSEFTLLCSPCYPEWPWPADGKQEKWFDHQDIDYEKIFFDDGPDCWTGEINDEDHTYWYWSGVWEDVSFREYEETYQGDYPWYYSSWCPAAATWNEENYNNYQVWGVFVLNYKYDWECNYKVNPYDADPSDCTGTIPFTYQLLFLCSHWPTPILCYEQYLTGYDEPEPRGIQCDFWDYRGEPIIFFSFKAYEPTDPDNPVYTDDYIQHAIIYDSNIYWSEKMKPAYGTTIPYYYVRRADNSIVGRCYGFARPVELRERKKKVITMEGAENGITRIS